MLSIKELQIKFSQNQESYRNAEIGSGVHSFIKECLLSAELFNLKETATKTDKNLTFVHDTEAKQHGRPDFVLFISADIQIPVEAKTIGSIDSGQNQLFRYQLDYSKHYGILTDGREWRFYRSNGFIKKDISDIMNNPKDFSVFWNGYIKPQNYYIEIFTPSGQLDFFKDKIILNESQNRPLFFDDITKVISKFKSKMSAIGVWKNTDGKSREKVAVETSYAYLIQFILYKVLVDNDFSKFKAQYSRLFSKIKKSLLDSDFYSIIINEIKNISEYISQKLYKPFAKEQESINKKLIDNLKQNLTIDDIAPWLDIIVFIDKYDFSNLKNEIFGFIYENYLKDLYGDKNKGQYFTDPAVVNFMLQEIGYSEAHLKSAGKDRISIIDPSCGAGTFLYSAVDKIIAAFDDGKDEASRLIQDLVDKNIFGLDIEEFPLYLCEMSILMKLLPQIVGENFENPVENKLKIFKTKDSISEFLDTGITSTKKQINLFEHLEKTALDYPSFMRDEKDLLEMLKSLQENMGQRSRFDFVIGNPPYIGYNECCKQKMPFTQKIKYKKDTTLTMGNVYGVNLHSVPNRRKSYPPKPNLYVFFIALGFALLKDGGKIAYIIPQTALTAGDLDVLRYHLSRYASIEKIITFDGNLFIGRGLKQNEPVATSSLIFVCKKSAPKENHKIKIVNYKTYNEIQESNFEKYLSGRNKEIKEILQSLLLSKVENWNFIKQEEIFSDFLKSYQCNSEDISIYYEHKISKMRFSSSFYFDIGFILDKKYFVKERQDYYPVLDFKQSCGYSKLLFSQYYPQDLQKIKLTKNSRYEQLGRKYNIVWSIKNFLGCHFTCEPIIFNMGAASIIASDNKKEILWLFSLLNCRITYFIIEGSLKINNEKEFLVSLKSIKQYIRIPKITKDNQKIKDEIIKETEKMLSLEDVLLKEIADFSSLSIQKFESIDIGKSNIILVRDLKEYKVKIKNGCEDLARQAISINLANADALLPIEREVSLQELKNLPAIDFVKQREIKDYIDDLVFALYFNIPVKNLGIEYAADIKKSNSKNEFYRLIN
jgi:methylase of polypeptide subunit release factors